MITGWKELELERQKFQSTLVTEWALAAPAQEAAADWLLLLVGTGLIDELNHDTLLAVARTLPASYDQGRRDRQAIDHLLSLLFMERDRKGEFPDSLARLESHPVAARQLDILDRDRLVYTRDPERGFVLRFLNRGGIVKEYVGSAGPPRERPRNAPAPEPAS